jgi:hypothetical protein
MVVVDSSPSIRLMSSEFSDTSIVEARRFRVFDPALFCSSRAGSRSSFCGSVPGVDGTESTLESSEYPFDVVIVEEGD